MVETEPETPKEPASAGSSRAHAANAGTEGLSQTGAAGREGSTEGMELRGLRTACSLSYFHLSPEICSSPYGLSH